MRMSGWLTLRFRYALALIAVPSAILVAVELYDAAAILPDLTRGEAAVAHTLQVIDAARALNASILDAERGQRGFVITGDPKYLDPYTAGVRSVPERLSELQRLIVGNPDQERRVALVRDQTEVKFAELKRTIDARQSGGFAAARDIVVTDVGYDSMRVVAQMIDSIIGAEAGALTQQRAQMAARQRGSAYASLLAAALALLVMAIGIVLLYGNLRRLTVARQAIAESEQRFRLLVNGVRDYALYSLDPDGHVVTWNEGAERLKGYREDEIAGRHFSCFYSPEDVAAGVPDRLLRTAAVEGRADDEGWRLKKDGSRFWAEAVLTALRHPDGSLRGFSKITRDVSERRQQQEALEQSRAVLAQAQKMEAVGQLTGGVAHDFNNLLTVIQGSLELLEQGGSRIGPDRLATLIGAARRAAERGASLTHHLLAFSRQQALSPENLDINRQVGGMSELLRRTLGEDIAIETVLAGGLWHSFIDPNQLENALLNLAVNARDAMPSGGKLTIETGNVYLDDDYAAAHEEVAAGQYVMLAVSDTGTGMTPETAARALDPFFTTKEVGKGTGLGLSQVYGFVKQSGGHLKIYSEFGRGTTVKIYLPRHLSAGAVSERAVERRPAVSSANGEAVLLVEDDADVREFGASALTHLGYRVFEAPDADAALAILGENPEIALLVTDVGLPGRSGRELADEAQRRAPNLKIVYTTGYARNAIVHGGVLDAGVELVPKPFTAAALGRKLRQMLGAA